MKTCQRSSFVLCAALVCFAASSVHAQTPPAAEPPAKPADYSAGFKKFYALGLPDVSKAVYVKLDNYSSEDMMYMHMGSVGSIRMTGNAWLLKEDKAAKSTFVAGHCKIVELYDYQAVQKEQMKAAKENARSGDPMTAWRRMAQQEQKPTGRWRPADLKSDVDKALAYLNKKDDKSSSRRYDELAGSGGYGQLFLFAIHAHSKGMTNEANAIVGALFARAKDSKKVISQGAALLAEVKLDETNDKFFAGGAWNAYAADLESVVKTFGTTWKKAIFMADIIADVKKRAALKDIPPLAGEGLTAEDRALAAELAEASISGANRMLAYAYSQNWLFPQAMGGFQMPNAETNALTRITGRGIKSVPLLLAMLEDDTLTRIDMQKLTGRSGMGMDLSMLDMMPDGMMQDRIKDQIRKSIRSPATRGDIALMLLLPLPPTSDRKMHQRDSVDKEALREQCAEWYAANKEKSVNELARDYVENGNSQQKQTAMQYLLQKGNDADAAAIEKFLLSPSSQPMQYAHFAQQYAMKRGEKAKPFVEQYEKFLRGWKPEGADADMYAGGEMGKWTEQILSSMKMLFATNSAEELLAEIAAGKEGWEKATGKLHTCMQSKDPEEALTMLLNAAARAENAKVTATLLNSCHIFRYSRRQRQAMMGGFMEEGGEEAEMKPPEPLDIKRHSSEWKKFLADERSMAEENADNFWYEAGYAQKPTVAQAAAGAIEACYGTADPWGGGASYGMYAHLLDPKIAADITLKRALARLDGKSGDDLPKFPSPDDVAPEKRKQTADRILAAKDKDAILAVFKASGPAERIALAEDIESNEGLRKQLAPLSLDIRDVKIKLANAEDAKPFTELRGSALGKDAIEKMIALARKLAAAGSMVQCQVMSARDLPGINLFVFEQTPDSEQFKKRTAMYRNRGNPRAQVSASFNASDLNGYATWLVEANAPAATKPKPDENQDEDQEEMTDDDEMLEAMSSSNDYMKEQQKEFWNSLDALMRGQGDAAQGFSLNVSGMPVIKPDKDAAARGGRGAVIEEDFAEPMIDF